MEPRSTQEGIESDAKQRASEIAKKKRPIRNSHTPRAQKGLGSWGGARGKGNPFPEEREELV